MHTRKYQWLGFCNRDEADKGYHGKEEVKTIFRFKEECSSGATHQEDISKSS